MINFYNTPPAYGFETSRANAENYYLNQSLEKDSTNKAQCDAILLDVANARAGIQTGLSESECLKIDLNRAARKAWKVANIVKGLGYIPFVGSLIGFYRIIKEIDAPMPNKYNHIARGCIEFLSLGFLLLIPDLILTYQKEKQAENAGFF